MPPETQQLQQQVEQVSQLLDRLMDEIGKVIVGQRDLLQKILIGLLSRGHILLEGVPGLAKTLTLQTLSTCLSLQFQRVQFTPDLLPADILGTQLYDQQAHQFVPKFGPVFTNIVLADEINRAPAKVQSALLEAMQEKQVTIGEQTYALPDPFLVMATQNPVEQEGTYPLPEAQVDRFMLKLLLDYPSRSEELQIMDRMIERPTAQLQAVMPLQHLQAAQQLVKQIHIDPKIKEYIVDLIFCTREPEKYGLAYRRKNGSTRSLAHYIEHGASPRATLALNLAARSHAILSRRCYVIPDDVKIVARDVLRHRISLSYEAQADELSSDDLLIHVLNHLDVP
ncbi:MAG TPA: ATPase [Myxococcales bacterium]|nr:ATPase [Deltaproteobacteria bacterium]HAA53314.1 ATPase [Myxococcales bacterium]